MTKTVTISLEEYDRLQAIHRTALVQQADAAEVSAIVTEAFEAGCAGQPMPGMSEHAHPLTKGMAELAYEIGAQQSVAVAHAQRLNSELCRERSLAWRLLAAMFAEDEASDRSRQARAHGVEMTDDECVKVYDQAYRSVVPDPLPELATVEP